MSKLLSVLFILTLCTTCYGLLNIGFSLSAALILLGPVAVSLFTAAAFVFLFFAVMFETKPIRSAEQTSPRDHWLSDSRFQHSNG